jgi:WbqC-like protein family
VTTLAALQPGYLPWVGYFDLMRRADIFVSYDHVQFDKHGWRNRNRIKCAHGVQWLTVPVRHRGLGPQRLLDVRIDDTRPWARKHITSLQQCYASARYAGDYLPALAEVLLQPWRSLVELDLAVASLMCRWLGLDGRVVRSSELELHGDRSQRLLDLCHRFGATRYLSGESAKVYLDVELFAAGGVSVEWQAYVFPAYPQRHGEFVPYLSAIDLILNCGPDSATVLAGGT